MRQTKINNLWDKIRVYFKALFTDGITEENLEKYIKSKNFLYSHVAGICFIIAFLNYQKEEMMMALITVSLGLVMTVCIILNRQFQWLNISTGMLSLVFILVFTYFLFSGVNAGFAVLWLLPVPLFSMGFCGVKWGTLTGGVFFLMIPILFYSPLRIMFTEKYSAIFLQRFPILYGMTFLVSFVLMQQKHIQDLKQLDYQKELEKAVVEERNRVSIMSLQTILAISNTIEAKDAYTKQHSVRVAGYSEMIARELNWQEEEIRRLVQIAMLHDIGKIGVDGSILTKPGKLTENEYAEIKKHTTIGADILKELTMLPNVQLGALYHHERYDGKGYPQGLPGEEIPIEARIIAVADAYDAMASRRSYRDMLPQNVIRQEVVKGKGTQFDPEIADILLKLIDRDVEYVMHE